MKSQGSKQKVELKVNKLVLVSSSLLTIQCVHLVLFASRIYLLSFILLPLFNFSHIFQHDVALHGPLPYNVLALYLIFAILTFQTS